MTRILAIAALALVATGCSTTDTGQTKFDPTKAQEYEHWAEFAYSSAKVSLAVLCATAPNTKPCNSATAMAAIAKAETVLDVAFTKARDEIAKATDMDGLTLALTTFENAVAVYAQVMASYGVHKGGA